MPGWIKRISLFTLSSIFAQGLTIFYTIFVATQLWGDELGAFTACYSLAGLTVFLTIWGVDTWLLKEASAHPKPLLVIGQAFQFRGAAGLLWLAGMGIIPAFIRPDLFDSTLIIICSIDVFFETTINTGINALNALGNSKKASLAIVYSRSIRLLIALVIAGHANTAIMFSIGRALSSISIAGYVLVGLKPNLFTKGLQVKKIIRQLFLYGTSDALALIYVQADITILAFLSGSNIAALYAMASNLIKALFAIPNAIFISLVPILTKMLRQQTALFKKRSLISIGAFSLIGFLGTLGIFLFGKPVTTLLLGERFAISGDMVQVMSFIFLFKCVEFGCISILVAANKQQYRLLPQLIAVIANLSLNFYLIPFSGAWGAVIAYLVSEFLLMLGYLIAGGYFFKQILPKHYCADGVNPIQ